MEKPSGLVHDPHVRQIRTATKHRRLLRFLRDECWTNTEIAAGVMGVGHAAAYRTLHAMQRDRYLKSEDLILYSHISNVSPVSLDLPAPTRRYVARKVMLWGITPHGLAYAWDLDEDMQDRPSFELGKTHPAYVEHYVSIQRLRLAAEAAGWQTWTPGRLLMGQKLAKVPDGEATDSNGARVAVEYEREIKTPKRYQTILGAYLVALKAGRWQRVDYVCPSRDLAARLQRIFYAIREVIYKGQKAAITQEHLTNRVTFSGLDDWPAAQAVQL
jgi:hypothetical protein